MEDNSGVQMEILYADSTQWMVQTFCCDSFTPHRGEAEAEGVAVDPFECAACMEDIPACAGIRLVPGAEGCSHCLCRACFERLCVGQLERRRLVACPTCKRVCPGWLVGAALRGGEAAQRMARTISYF